MEDPVDEDWSLVPRISETVTSFSFDSGSSLSLESVPYSSEDEDCEMTNTTKESFSQKLETAPCSSDGDEVGEINVVAEEDINTTSQKKTHDESKAQIDVKMKQAPKWIKKWKKKEPIVISIATLSEAERKDLEGNVTCPICWKVFTPRVLGAKERWRSLHSHCRAKHQNFLPSIRKVEGGYHCPHTNCSKVYSDRVFIYVHCLFGHRESLRCRQEFNTSYTRSAEQMKRRAKKLNENENAAKLYSAAKSGRAKEVEALLIGGTDPNKKYDDGYTALMTAAEAGHHEVVDIMLQHKKVNENLRNVYGQSALGFAIQNGHKRVVEVFVTRQSGGLHRKAIRNEVTKLAESCQRGDILQVLQQAIENMDVSREMNNSKTHLQKEEVYEEDYYDDDPYLDAADFHVMGKVGRDKNNLMKKYVSSKQSNHNKRKKPRTQGKVAGMYF